MFNNQWTILKYCCNVSRIRAIGFSGNSYALTLSGTVLSVSEWLGKAGIGIEFNCLELGGVDNIYDCGIRTLLVRTL